ncbi:hypothetical protein SDC9_179396 [bioreactor metagenome]|uniref:Uncharacterized protein n=1 Tax=bioreactor metagenome TaxID=1076179 RepID=A0A645GYJ0_9ZZZZ
MKLYPPSMEAMKEAVLSPPWAVILTMMSKAFVGEPSAVTVPEPSPVFLGASTLPAVVAATGRQYTRAAPNWTASMTESARGDRPSRDLILSAVMSPVTMIGVSETIGETPTLMCRPSPVAVAKPSKPSVTECVTSLSITSSPRFPYGGRSWAPR